MVAGAFNNRDASQMSLKQAAGGEWKNVTPRLTGRNEFVNLQSSTVNAPT
jgi:nuclear transport factor 2 (NTF2) superfamily protein